MTHSRTITEARDEGGVTMLFWLGLVTGLIIGWLIGWLIDWRFWRRDLNATLTEERRWRTELEDAQREIQRLQALIQQKEGD